MRVKLADYSNDIVSLTLMALMSIALIAAQAQANTQQSAAPAADETPAALVIDVNFSLRSEGE